LLDARRLDLRLPVGFGAFLISGPGPSNGFIVRDTPLTLAHLGQRLLALACPG
jgi:hypothetical protein